MTNKQVIVNKPSRFSDEKRVVGKTRILTGAAMLSAVAYLLQFIEFQLPLSPSFAKFDFSEIPALIGGFAYGPVCGIAIEFIKNALQLTSTSTGGIGELANFVIGSSLVFPATLLYKKKKNKRTAIIGCIIGSVVSGLIAFVTMFLYKPLSPILKGRI